MSHVHSGIEIIQFKLPNIVKVTESKWAGWAGHVVHIGHGDKPSNCTKEMHEEGKQFESSGCNLEDFIVVLKPCNLYLLYVYIPQQPD